MYLILEKGYRDVIDDDFWEEEEERESALYSIRYTGIGIGIGNDAVLVGGRIETIGLLDDSLHLGLFIFRVATIYRSIQAPGKMKRLREMQDTAKVGQ